MTVNYTTLLGLAKPVTGTEQGDWGDVVNDEITTLLEDAVANSAAFSVAAGDVTLSTTSGATNQARMSTLVISGSPGVSRNIIAPSQAKIYQVINGSNAAVVIKGAATTGVTIAAGATGTVVWNGSDFIEIGSTSSGRTFNGNVTVNGVITAQAAATQDAVKLQGRAGGSSSYAVTITPTTLTANRTITAPDTALTLAGIDVAQTFTAVQTFTPAARTSGAVPYFTLTTPADTGQTSSTESIGASFTAATRTWATGSLTLQRERVFGAPTYAFAGASTLTTAINVDIGTPVAGSNATITNAWALRSGPSLFVGNVRAEAAATQDAVVVAGRAGGTSSYAVTITPTTLAANRTFTLPDATTVAAGLAVSQTFTGIQTFTPDARTSGANPYFVVTMPADTGQTAGTESIGVSYTAGTRTWSGGTLALQRERVFAAPTYAFGGASTLTTAINVDIATPAAGTNATITNAYALRAGASLFTGTLTMDSTNAIDTTNLEVTNIKAKDGTAAMSIADSTGAVSISTNLTIGDASGDTLTINGTAVSTPNGLNFDSDTLVIDAANDRVGIGTNAPAQKLHVNVASGNVYGQFSSGANNVYLGYENARGIAILESNSSLAFDVGASYVEKMRLTSTGTLNIVGAGTAGSTQAISFNGSTPVDTLVTDSSGRVGIGISSPAGVLNIKTSNGQFLVQNGTSAAQMRISAFNNAGNANAALIFEGYASEYGRFDASGNLGLGVTPSAWGAGPSAIQMQSASIAAQGTNTYWGSNWFGGGFDKYIATATASASLLVQTGGAFLFNTAGAPAAHTAGDPISFTQAMTLDASGNLGLGATTTAGGRVVITQNNATQPAIYLPTDESTIQGPGTDTQIKMGSNLVLRSSNVTEVSAKNASGYIGFATGATPTERARITSGGELLVGPTSVPSPVANYRSLVVGGSTGGIVDIGTTSTSYGRVSADSVGLNVESLGATTTIFRTDSTERARITSGGSFCVHDGTVVESGLVSFAKTTETTPVLTIKNPQYSCDMWATNTSGDNIWVRFFSEASATQRGSIAYNRLGGLVAYNTTSDYRAKDVTGPVANSGATIDALKVYNGKMKGATVERPMLIAHEAQAVTPYAVTGEKDAVDEDGKPKYQQMDVSSLVPLLIAEIQSLRARVAQLEQGA